MARKSDDIATKPKRETSTLVKDTISFEGGALHKEIRDGELESLEIELHPRRFDGSRRPRDYVTATVDEEALQELLLALMEMMETYHHPDHYEWLNPPCPHNIPCIDPCQPRVLGIKQPDPIQK